MSAHDTAEMLSKMHLGASAKARTVTVLEN